MEIENKRKVLRFKRVPKGTKRKKKFRVESFFDMEDYPPINSDWRRLKYVEDEEAERKKREEEDKW